MGEWQDVTLGEVAELSWGDTSKTKASYTESGYTAYSASGPDGLLPYFDHEFDGVVISAIGAQCGKTWRARGKWSCIKNTMWMRGRPGIADTGFLYYATDRAGFWPRRGAAQPFISLGDARDTSVALPGLAMQQRIAAVLSAFDELIEINERRIELLADLARSLYREWFVRRRYPGSPRDHPAGRLPDGWSIVPIGDACELIRGRSYRKVELSETGGVPFLNLKCVARGGGFRRDGLKQYTGRFKEAQRVLPGDVLVAVTDMTQERRIVAQAFRMPMLDAPFAVPSLDLVVLRPVAAELRTYLYAFLRYSGFADRVRHFANGANVLHLALERISEAPIVVPDDETLHEFSARFDALQCLGEALERSSRSLAATRDLLLPRLVTGRFEMSDVEVGELLRPDPE